MTLDAIGREIHAGDVCVHIHTRSSNPFFEAMIISELVDAEHVRGTKIVKDFIEVDGEYGYHAVQKQTRDIQSCKLIITGMSEAQLKDHYGII